MPDYRKKRRNRILSSHSRPKRTSARSKQESEEIKMTPESERKVRVNENKNQNMRVVKGKKTQRKRKAGFFTCFIAVVAAVVLVLQMILPAGILQTVKNTVAILGAGSYPIELNSNDTLNVVSMGNYYYVLSDTTLSAYSNSGKELFSYAHGFEYPVIETSRFGALLINQGNTSALIFDLGGIKKTVETEKNIITAAISDSGAYALVTESDNYACAVSVYSKAGKTLYEWYSSEDVVNNITVSPNNKKIAVSTFRASGGKYTSKVQILNFKSATAEYSADFDSLIFDLSNKASGRFIVTSLNQIKYIKWNNYTANDYTSSYDVSITRESNHGTVAVFGRSSDPTDNKVAVFSKTGKLKFEFKFNGIISDIRLFGGHIYCMSDTNIYLLDQEGNILRTASSGFGGVKLVVTGTNSVLSITDNKIEKIKLDEEKSE